MTNLAGRPLLNHRIESKIGGGGMGEVYRGHPVLNSRIGLLLRLSVVVFLLFCTATPAAQQHSMVMFHYPRWSPDGQWLVFSTNIDGGDEEVWLVSRDGAVKRKLTDNAVADTGADWHPDGRRIVFQRPDGRGTAHFVMNADGTGVAPYRPAVAPSIKGLSAQERRTARGQAVVVWQTGGEERPISSVRWAEQPTVSPDGQFVLFEQRDDPGNILGSDIALWDSRTNLVRVLARGTDPSWSPNGRTVMFKTPRGPGNALFIMTLALPDGEPRTLARGVHPHFSPDGATVAFMTDGTERTDIFVIGTDGRGERCLTCSWK